MIKGIHIHFLIFIVALMLQYPDRVFAQPGMGKEDSSQMDIRELYRQAKSFYVQESYLEALNLAERALQLSMSEEKIELELRILELMGDIYHAMDQSSNGIPYYLRSAGLHEAQKDTTELIRLYEKIAVAYRSEHVYSRERVYYENLLDLVGEGSLEKKTEIRSRIGTAAYHDGEYDTAIELFRPLRGESIPGSDQWTRLTQDLVTVFDAAGRYDSALHYSRKLLGVYREKGDQAQEVRVLNNTGYYYTVLGSYSRAAGAYLSAIEQAEETDISRLDIATMRSNAAVAYSNMGREKEAILHFTLAIETFRELEYYRELSRNENMLATLYLSTGDLYNAGLFSRRAIQSAGKAGDPLLRGQAYQTYSSVLRRGNDPVNALDYYEKYLSIRDSLELSRRVKVQQLESRKNFLEQQERALKLRLKEDQVSELTIGQLRLENEKMEQEQELIMQERNLDLLKQDSLRQSIIITRQQFEVDRQKRENQLLEQEKQLAELKLKEEEQAKKAAERETMIADQKARLAVIESEKQLAEKKAFRWMAIGAGALAILILVSLISTRRKNLLLARQKKEIEEKNIDLEQKNEEISTQRDEIEAQRNLVYDQKQAIEAYNDEVLKSIAYAKRLQSAALPPRDFLEEKVEDQFVFFRPRDVVSGDFYWFAEVEEKLVATVADCTGHGVPGAFMSMMGMSLLKEIVQKEYITHPGVILRRMRKEIINAMGQKGISGEQRDGMDMALVSFDPHARMLDFAGAYNSLYLVRSKSLEGPVIEEGRLEPSIEDGSFCLYEIPADKMPVAHYDRMDKFRNHQMKMEKGDTVYMFTDGFADQFGGKKGKKFMYKPFKKLLLKNSRYTLKQQEEILANTLDKWMGDIAQVDDICVMGLRF